MIEIDTVNNKYKASSDAIKMPLTAQEEKIIEVIRKLDYGEVRIVIKGSEIVQIEEKKSIKL